MRFTLQCQSATWREADDSRIPHKRAHDIRRVDCVGACAQLVNQRWARKAAFGSDVCAEGFVRTMLAPRLRDGFKLNIGGVNATL